MFIPVKKKVRNLVSIEIDQQLSLLYLKLRHISAFFCWEYSVNIWDLFKSINSLVLLSTLHDKTLFNSNIDSE